MIKAQRLPIIALVILCSTLVLNISLASLIPYHDEEGSYFMHRNLGGKSGNKKSQKGIKAGNFKNKNKNDDDQSNNDDIGQRYSYVDDKDDDHAFLYDDGCVDPQAPFYVENKNIVIRCIELNEKSKLFACSWPTVKNRCPCRCRKFDGSDNINVPDYDDVYKYRDDDFSPPVEDNGIGGGDGSNNNNDGDIISCKDVSHPFSIFQDYTKVLVYCSDLEKSEFSFACNRDRPKKKCPVTCNLCKPPGVGDDYVDYIDNNDDGKNNDNDCSDSSNTFKMYLDGRKIKFGCPNLKENQFRQLCKRDKGKTKCPLTCGMCSSDNDDTDDYTTDYIDDTKNTNVDGFNSAFHDDDIIRFFDGTYDDDVNIVYIDDTAD